MGAPRHHATADRRARPDADYQDRLARQAAGGEHEAWETEALSQRTVVAILRDRLTELLPRSIADVNVRERAEQEDLLRYPSRYRLRKKH